MTTQEIADRLVELCRAGKYDECYDTLFSPDVVTVGPTGSPEEEPTVGMSALKAKGEKWNDMFEEFLGGWVGDPIVVGNNIALAMGFEAIYKGETQARKEDELVVYTIKDGKIVKEEYFYDVV